MKKILYIICLSLISSVAFSQGSLDSGLVAYYPFDGNPFDYTSYSNHPSFYNSVLTNDRFGNANSAYYFNGTSSYIRVPNKPSINFNNTMSICVWMKPMGYYKGLCYNNMILCKAITDNVGSNQGNYSLRFADYVNGCNSLADTTQEYLFGPDGGVCQNQTIQLNRWYFVVFTTDGITCRTYINNKLSHIGAHPSGQTYTNQHDLLIGMFGGTGQFPYYFNGVLDDIRLYNRALSSDEIVTLYNKATNPSILGNVYVDENNNGIMDGNDFYKPNVRINGSNGGFAITNFNGEYDLTTDSLGLYTTTINTPTYYNSTPSSYNYYLSNYDTTVKSDYVLTNTMWPIDSVTLKLVPLFNRARPGFNYPVGITYINEGNTNLSNAVFTLNYDSSKLHFINSTNANVVDNGTSLSIPANTLVAGQRVAFNVNFTINTYATLGNYVNLLGNISASPVSVSDSSIAIISGSYDPNDKQATPLLSTTDVANGKYIDYIVRFENTGTDTAFTVVIADAINTNYLDVNSLQLMGMSHGCMAQINDNKVSFVFTKINLPYKAIDPIKSHGFVAFRIKPKSTVGDGVDIPNTASIYFDYNLPIITNTAFTKIRNSVIVPTKIVQFNSNLINTNKAVFNTWVTTNELNINCYNLQYSINGKDFETIATIKANNKNNNEYSFVHNILAFKQATTLYYKLQAIDNNGKVTNSNINAIVVQPTTTALSIYPNPAKSNIVINRVSAKVQTAVITDALGKVVKTFVLNSLSTTISINDLAIGLYSLKVDNETINFIKE